MRRRNTNDDGFTLIELIVVVAVLAVVLGALTTGVITLMRASGDITDRLVVSHDEQLLNEWITADVQSSSDGSIDTTEAAPTGCSSPLPAVPSKNVVNFSWTDRSTTPTDTVYHAAYRAEQLPAPQNWELVRYWCAAGTPASRLVVIHGLKDGTTCKTGPPSASACVNVTADPNFKLRVTSVSGIDEYTFTVSADRRSADFGAMDNVPPHVMSVVAYNTDPSGVPGLVNLVRVTFDEQLDPDYTAGTAPGDPWTLTNVPNNATLASVAVKGNVALLSLTGGTGTAVTHEESFRVALAANPNGIRDGFGNEANSDSCPASACEVADAMAPNVLGAVATDSDDDLKFNQVELTFSEALVEDSDLPPGLFTLTAPPGWPGVTLVVLAASAAGNEVTLSFYASAGSIPANTGLPNGMTVAAIADPTGVHDPAGSFAKVPTTQVTDGTAPGVISLESFDTNQNGKLDRIRAVFSEPLQPYTAGNGVWSVIRPPSSAWSGANPTVTVVSVAGNTATLTISESDIPIDTAANGLELTLNSDPGGIRDAAGNLTSFTGLPVTDRMRPILVGTLAFPNPGSTSGMPQPNDTMTATFSEPLAPSWGPTATIAVSFQRTGSSSAVQVSIPNFLASPVTSGSNYMSSPGVATWNSATIASSGTTITVRLAGSCTGSGCALLTGGSFVSVSLPLHASLDDALGQIVVTPSASISIRWF